MDDVMELHLPANKAMQFQSVQLYLRVSLLSEITNHCGTHLLPAAMQQHRPAPNNPYRSQNHSTLQWPHQPPPGPKAWNTWKEILAVLYLQPNSYQLSQPLGQWNEDYAVDYHWVWQMCLKSHTLFHHHDGKWVAFTPSQQTPTHIQY